MNTNYFYRHDELFVFLTSNVFSVRYEQKCLCVVKKDASVQHVKVVGITRIWWFHVA